MYAVITTGKEYCSNPDFFYPFGFPDKLLTHNFNCSLRKYSIFNYGICLSGSDLKAEYVVL